MSRINDVLWDLREAYRAELDNARKKKLQKEYDRALEAVLETTGKAIGDNTAAYEAAIDGLEESIAALKNAKSDLAKTAAAIRKVAKAVDVIVKVARKVAGIG